MLSTTRSLWSFVVPFLAWLAFGLAIIVLTDRQWLHVEINGWHNPLLDTFFKYITYLGDGIFGVFVVILGFVYRIRYGVIGLIGFLGSAIITQVLKRQVFSDELRPSAFFHEIAQLHFVDGVTLHNHFSFPSGHATAAFAIFLFLALLTSSKTIQFLCFILALITAFSRVYISQHFFEDIYVGSIIGTAVTFTAIHFLKDRTWGERGVIELFER